MSNRVCPKLRPLTDSEVRILLSHSMMRLTMGRRVTLGEAARDLCVDEKTAQRIRNEQTLAKATTVIGMILQDDALSAELLALRGERAVPLDGAELSPDALPSAAGLTHHLVLVQSPDSDGGADITDAELIAGRALIERSHAATAAMLDRIARIEAKKTGRAA